MAPLQTMTIGDVARRSSASVATIRYYESLGLLPKVTRQANGRRTYDAAILASLQLVISLRAAGLSLADVRAFVNLKQSSDGPCSELADIAAARAGELRKRILALRQAEARLSQFAQSCTAECQDRPACDCASLAALTTA